MILMQSFPKEWLGKQTLSRRLVFQNELDKQREAVLHRLKEEKEEVESQLPKSLLKLSLMVENAQQMVESLSDMEEKAHSVSYCCEQIQKKRRMEQIHKLCFNNLFNGRDHIVY